MSFKVTKRTNTATLVINFEDADSCIEAINFIRENCPLANKDRQYSYTAFSAIFNDNEKQVVTSRIKIIKLVRSYGLFVQETKNTGLKTAKEWVLKHEREWESRASAAK